MRKYYLQLPWYRRKQAPWILCPRTQSNSGFGDVYNSIIAIHVAISWIILTISEIMECRHHYAEV